jgi:dCMP deaminase
MAMDKQYRWDIHFLNLALAHAKMSKDPSTKVGAIIVGPDLEIRSVGFNGFPRGIADTNARLDNRELKYRLVVHAELNAILAAARVGTPVNGCTMYVANMGFDGRRLGGPPCTRCMVEIIQSGIKCIVGDKQNYEGHRWHEDGPVTATELMIEANINYREIV